MSRLYPARPIIGIGMIVLRPGAVLLIRRGNAPNQGAWSIPGGAQELGETAEAAARRELLEEAGVTAGTLHLVAIVDSILPDADGRIRYHYTIIDYATLWQGDPPRAGGDAADVAWVPFDRFDHYQLWDEARRVIARARTILRL